MKALVAGCGMIGTNVLKILGNLGYEASGADLIFGQDLRNADTCYPMTHGMDVVFHLADRTLGIGYSSKHHGEMLTNSLLISLQLLEAARMNGVATYLYVSSSCVYPDEQVFNQCLQKEEWGHFGPPESANQGYAWAKRIAELQCIYYAQEYGMRTVIVRPANIYGPSYDWNNHSKHVIPSLILKMLRQPSGIEIWGSGNQTRSFMFERDTANLIVELSIKGHAGEAYNLGGDEITIRDLALMLAKICEFRGQLDFDNTAPEGPLRKAYDTARLEACLGSSPRTSLFDGLTETVQAARKVLNL